MSKGCKKLKFDWFPEGRNCFVLKCVHTDCDEWRTCIYNVKPNFPRNNKKT